MSQIVLNIRDIPNYIAGALNTIPKYLFTPMSGDIPLIAYFCIGATTVSLAAMTIYDKDANSTLPENSLLFKLPFFGKREQSQSSSSFFSGLTGKTEREPEEREREREPEEREREREPEKEPEEREREPEEREREPDERERETEREREPTNDFKDNIFKGGKSKSNKKREPKQKTKKNKQKTKKNKKKTK